MSRRFRIPPPYRVDLAYAYETSPLLSPLFTSGNLDNQDVQDEPFLTSFPQERATDIRNVTTRTSAHSPIPVTAPQGPLPIVQPGLYDPSVLSLRSRRRELVPAVKTSSPTRSDEVPVEVPHGKRRSVKSRSEKRERKLDEARQEKGKERSEGGIPSSKGESSSKEPFFVVNRPPPPPEFPTESYFLSPLSLRGPDALELKIFAPEPMLKSAMSHKKPAKNVHYVNK